MRVGHILPRILREDLLWRSLFEVCDEVVGGPLAKRIQHLRERLNVDALNPASLTGIAGDTDLSDAEKVVVRQLAYSLGYHYTTDDADVVKLLRYVRESTAVSQISGTRDALDFVGYLMDVYLSFDLLWYDETNEAFYTENDDRIQGRRLGIDGNGPAFNVWRTPYISLGVEQTANSTKIENVISVFNAIASIDVVLHDVTIKIASPLVNININAYPVLSEIEIVEIQG